MSGALLFLVACSSTPTMHNNPLPDGDWKARISSQEKDGVKVSAAVPSAKESKEIFGNSLYKKGIQPVWLESSKKRNALISFFPVGLDTQYLPPL